MSAAGDLWRCPRCKGEKRDDPTGPGVTYAIQCGCGTEMELVELAAPVAVGMRVRGQGHARKARFQRWEKLLGEAAQKSEPAQSLQEAFLNWCGAGGGI